MPTDDPFSLDPARTALVNVHWQHDIVTADGAFAPFFAESVHRHGVIGTTRELVENFRNAGSLIVWARAAFQPGYPELLLNTGLDHAIKDFGALIEEALGRRSFPNWPPETMNRWSATRGPRRFRTRHSTPSCAADRSTPFSSPASPPM